VPDRAPAVERGVRFVQIYSGAWRTAELGRASRHRQEPRRFAAKTDQPIAALLTDLKARGLLDSTLVLCNGEFGVCRSSRRGTGATTTACLHLDGRRRSQGGVHHAPPTRLATGGRRRVSATTCTHGPSPPGQSTTPLTYRFQRPRLSPHDVADASSARYSRDAGSKHHRAYGPWAAAITGDGPAGCRSVTPRSRRKSRSLGNQARQRLLDCLLQRTPEAFPRPSSSTGSPTTASRSSTCGGSSLRAATEAYLLSREARAPCPPCWVS